jgi:hypothetical protein
MKVDFAAIRRAEASARGSQGKRILVPAIPLERPAVKQYKNKTQLISLKLRTDPANADSPVYEKTIPVFIDGDAEEWLIRKKDILQALAGLNIHGGPAKYTLARRFLAGSALAKFNDAATVHGDETPEHFDMILDDITMYIFPARAIATQKRWMRRFLRKPRDLLMRQFLSRVTELNDYLAEFPDGNENSKLPPDEFMDLAEFSAPVKWQKKMVEHGFDPALHTQAEFVEFCERIETTEAFDTTNTNDTHYTKEQKFRATPYNGA